MRTPLKIAAAWTRGSGKAWLAHSLDLEGCGSATVIAIIPQMCWRCSSDRGRCKTFYTFALQHFNFQSTSTVSHVAELGRVHIRYGQAPVTSLARGEQRLTGRKESAEHDAMQILQDGRLIPASGVEMSKRCHECLGHVEPIRCSAGGDGPRRRDPVRERHPTKCCASVPVQSSAPSSYGRRSESSETKQAL